MNECLKLMKTIKFGKFHIASIEKYNYTRNHKNCYIIFINFNKGFVVWTLVMKLQHFRMK